MSLDSGDLEALLGSFLLHLRGERKSPETVKSYRNGVRGFLSWCERENIPPELDPPTVDAWVAALLEGGAEPATARLRQLAGQRRAA